VNADAVIPVLLKLLSVVVLVLLNGFFVAAEFAFVKLRETQVATLAAQGNRRAALAQRLVRNLETCISATQMGVTLCGVGTGIVMKPAFEALLHPLFRLLGLRSPGLEASLDFFIGFLVSSYLLIVVGVLVPKTIAIRRTHWFHRLAYPCIWVLNRSAQWLLDKLGIGKLDAVEQAHSDDEMRLLLSAVQKRAGGASAGRDILLNAFDLPHRLVRDVMRPRRDIVGLSTTASLAECLDIAERTRYSRFPLCEGGDLDRTLGVVHIKDLYALRIKARSGADLQGVTRRLIYVPETARLEKLLQFFLDRKLHFAIVVDEYGCAVGMVTLENVLEELVGQIQDEFDTEKPLLVRTGDQTWEIDGLLPLHELADLIGERLVVEGVATTSGLVTQRLGGFPREGDVVRLGNHELQVLQTDGPRVIRLKLVRAAARPPGN
jgi:CBS domain containing-hemolysin-like protein